MQLLETYAEDVGVAETQIEIEQLGEQLSNYLGREGLFSCNMFNHSSPIKYWKNYLPFEETKMLAKIGCRLASISASSADVGRSFSVQSQLHTKSRNRMKKEVVDKVMRVKSALLHKIQSKDSDTQQRTTDSNAGIIKNQEQEQEKDEEDMDEDEIVYFDEAFTLADLEGESEPTT